MAKKKNHPIVLVEWFDSTSFKLPWYDKEDDPEGYQVAVCRSVGWLLDKDKTRIVLYSDTGDSQHGRFLAIPIKCITSMKVLVAK
jgi:hypothetical protein